MTESEFPADAVEQVVDHVIPVLPPYETSVYLYLLRWSRLVGSRTVRVGKRTIGEGIGKGTRSARGGNYQHIDEKLNALAREGFIQIGDTNRLGTLYAVALPYEVPSVRAHLDASSPSEVAQDHFRDPVLRRALFERDDWRCRYCGDALTPDTATLDHVVPQADSGTDEPSNLATACLMCNSIKSGRSYTEAAGDMLAALQARRAASE